MYNSYVIVLLGLSGVGKSHFVNIISQNSCNNIHRLIAVTTRPKRINEVEGVDKFFLSKDQFLSDRKTGAYLFDNIVYGEYYAYLKSDFCSQNTYICELYWRTYLNFKKILGKNCISIYIKPLNASMLETAIIKRDPDKEIAQFRIRDNNNDVKELLELENQGLFDYSFTNDYTKEADEKFQLLIDSILKRLGREVT